MCGNNLRLYFTKYAQNVYTSIFQNSSDIKVLVEYSPWTRIGQFPTIWDGKSMFEFHHCIPRNNV